MTCRMYDKKPLKVENLCLQCAARNGWKGCDRSKRQDLAAKYIKMISAS